MSTDDLDAQILEAIRTGNSTREKLMAIERLRHRTWSVVKERLDALTRSRALIASKTGWRIL